MNSSMWSLDLATHLKIIATALLAATAVVWIAVAAHTSTPRAASVTKPLHSPSYIPVRPSPAPVEPTRIVTVKSDLV